MSYPSQQNFAVVPEKRFGRFTIKLVSALLLQTSFAALGASYTTPRALNVGDTYLLTRDGWGNNSPSGYDGDVVQKTDANDSLSQDNPYFRRHNVARAWPTGTGYWFTGSDQHEGEPDPADPQWVDYVPPFETLGPGRYLIEASYRWSSGRASYPALYIVNHALGNTEVRRDQRIGSANTTIYWFTLGEFEMRPGSYVRVEDTGSESITFGNMRFILQAPVPQLQVSTGDGNCLLHWPTNASNYHLECTADLTPYAYWQSVFDTPTREGSTFSLSLPMTDLPKFYRLATP